MIAFVVAVFGVLIAAAIVDQSDAGGLGAKQAWLYVTILTVGYMVSRGLAKSGSSQPYDEDRSAPAAPAAAGRRAGGTVPLSPLPLPSAELRAHEPMDTTKTKVLQYLDEAHAHERSLVSVLSSQIAMTPRGSYRSALETHLGATREHAERVGRRRKALGGGSGPLGSVLGLAETVVGQALAIGKTPLDLLRGSGGEEKVLKNAKDACATEALEIATYTTLERLARVVGDTETADLGGLDPRRRGRRCSNGSRASCPSSPTPSCAPTSRASTGSTSPRPAPPTPPARPAARPPPRLARRPRRPSGSPRQARKLPGVARAEGAAKGAVASEGDLAIAGYDSLNADEIIGRLAEPVAGRAGQGRRLRAQEPEPHDDPQPHLDTLRRNEPSPAGVPARANDAHAMPDEYQELKTAAAAGDAAAAFTLWERLREVDFAAAEGWLRTAVDLGDVRAAHRRGMLLWERRDVDAAEATLRRATDDPEGAHALGRLLLAGAQRPGGCGPLARPRWPRRMTPRPSAISASSCASTATFSGAHYWLSRAADRDGEAREVLAALDTGQ